MSVFVRAWLQGLEFGDLITQEFHGRVVIRVPPGERGEFSGGLLPVAPSRAGTFEEGAVLAEIIEDLPLNFRAGKRVVGVLAMDVHQGLARLAQQLRGDGRPVQPGAGASMRAD